MRLLCGIPDPLQALSLTPRLSFYSLQTPFQGSFKDPTAQPLSRGVTPLRFGSLQRFSPYKSSASGVCLIPDFLYAFMVWLPSLRLAPVSALRSCFISQRSWDSPFRVFPLLQRRPSLRMIPSSHYVGLKTWPRTVKNGVILKLRMQSIDLRQRVRSQMKRCYSYQIADTLLGLAFLEFSPL